MWLTKESNHEITIKSFPFLMWLPVLLALIGEFYLLKFYLGEFDYVSQLFKSGVGEALIQIGIVSLLPICGLIWLYYFPILITRINRRERTVRVERFGIFGKQVDLFNFDALDGGFRVKAEEDEDNKEHLKLYFKLKSGNKIFLSSDFTTFWKGKAYDIAMKANEYLRPQIENKI